MKLQRSLFILPLLGLLSAGTVQGDDLMKITDERGNEVVTMKTPESTSSDFDLSISGFNIGFRTRNHETSSHVKYKKSDPHVRKYKSPIGLLEFGYNMFSTNDYAINSPGGDYAMAYRSTSTHIQWNIIRGSEPLNLARTLEISTALGLAWDKYSFDNRCLTGADCRLSGKGLDKPAKLRTFSLTMPIMLGVNVKKMVVGAGLYGTVSLSQKHKNMIVGMTNELGGTNFLSKANPDAGVIATFGFRSIRFYAKYSFRKFSNSSVLPKTNVMSFGISLF